MITCSQKSPLADQAKMFCMIKSKISHTGGPPHLHIPGWAAEYSSVRLVANSVSCVREGRFHFDWQLWFDLPMKDG